MINPKVKDFLDEFSTIMDAIERDRKALFRTIAGEAYTIEQVATIGCIKQLNNCTSSQLAEIFDVKRSSVTSIVNNLVKKNLVTRTGDPNDRRNIILTLTEEGDRLYDEKIKEFYDLLTPGILTLKDEEIEDMRKGLKMVETLLKKANKK